MPSLSACVRTSLPSFVSRLCPCRSGSGSGSNVTQSQTGARDVISLVPVCSAFPFRSRLPVVRLSVGSSSIIAHTKIHTHAACACTCTRVCVCACVYIDENSFNAPHVLGRLPLLPSASFAFCHLFCAHFCARYFWLLFRLHFTWLLRRLVYPWVLFAQPFAEQIACLFF